jgi:murein DD-endopeptidase MepM/ murein hydrolase activator NlpD
MYCPLAPKLFLPICLLLALAGLAQAEKLYKHRDANGTIVFSDRQPAVRNFEVSQVNVESVKSRFGLRKVGDDDNCRLVAVNEYRGPVEVRIDLPESHNVTSNHSFPARFVIPGSSERETVRLWRTQPGQGFSYTYNHTYVFGDPAAEHRPKKPYRLPIPAGRGFTITQSFKGAKSHSGPQNQYAVDIAMPQGTRIMAARSGVIMAVANDFFTGGADARFRGRANYVRVLHDDGTMAVYAHLKLETVQYPVGARVDEGQFIAEAGSTGYSTGPHLHFAIQKNFGMELKSLPFEFADKYGRAFTPESGMKVSLN